MKDLCIIVVSTPFLNGSRILLSPASHRWQPCVIAIEQHPVAPRSAHPLGRDRSICLTQQQAFISSTSPPQPLP